MTPRDRKARDGMSATATVPAAIHSTAASTVRNTGDVVLPRILRWEDWFQSASAAQRGAEMLDLAARQGLLYGFQIPQATNGVKHKAAPENQCIPRHSPACLPAKWTTFLLR